MATALARILEDDHFFETLILCPRNLVPMWEHYRERYRLRAKVISIGMVQSELPTLRRYRLVIIDESHSLRNREGKRYRAIAEYIRMNDAKCVLLSATPYNKTYEDLSNQLRLFVPEERDLGIRPERLIREIGETTFTQRHQCPVRSIAAFEKSPHRDDWRDLMRLFLVRRTRTFIQTHYAELDPASGRRFLAFADGRRSYFPERRPRTVAFPLAPQSQYEQLYSADVVDTINALRLPRYGLGSYVRKKVTPPAEPGEAAVLQNLSRAGQRLMGFCRTNLFKRLESSGSAFLQSVERHVLRNHVLLHALAHDLPLPIGSQSATQLDSDSDVEAEGDSALDPGAGPFAARAAAAYGRFRDQGGSHFTWVSARLFTADLRAHLQADADVLAALLDRIGLWSRGQDGKLAALHSLVTEQHAGAKVLVFTQFADTATYLDRELRAAGLADGAVVTGDSLDPTQLVLRFSPRSNEAPAPASPIRVLVATDVLSEGQNLQDAAVVVNFDLPWAIIRLVQRAGRVDRIGQTADQILCYSFLPADGVERIINLRGRVRRRLLENADVVGTDEVFFEDDVTDQQLVDLYSEKAGIMDDHDDNEVDLASYALQIWKDATDRDPALKTAIPALPGVIYATRRHEAAPEHPEGVLVYVRTAEGNDALAYVDREGRSITESQLEILKMAACQPETPPQARDEQHHDLVTAGTQLILREERQVGGQLGKGPRLQCYERLKRHQAHVAGTLFDSPDLSATIDEVYQHALRVTAADTLIRHFKAGIADHVLADLVLALREEGRLTIRGEDSAEGEPRILCSLGLFAGGHGPGGP